MTTDDSASTWSPNAKRWIAFAVLVGLALRIWEAVESSLWLDETHTLFHASQPTVAALLDTVKRDFHVPLFFLVTHFCGDFSSGAWLRWIPIASSLLTFVPIVALARETRGGERAAIVCAWLVALLPYQIHYAAELRPYEWLELFSASAAWAALSERGSKRTRLIVFFASILLGMFTHRIMALTVAAIGAARLFVRRPKLVGLPSLILTGAVAAAPTLPWLFSFAKFVTEKRDDYVEQVGSQPIRMVLIREVRDLPLRLVEPFMGSLGAPWSYLAYCGVAAFALLGVWLAVRWWSTRRELADDDRPRILTTCAIFAVVLFALITAFSIYSWDRVPLQYYIGISWVIPLALAAWISREPNEAVRRNSTIAWIGASFVLGVALAGGESRENFRGAVELARQWGNEIAAKDPAHPPIYTAVLAQPSGVFEHVLPYRAYGRDLGAIEPDKVPAPASPEFARHLIVIRRALPLTHDRWKPILDGRMLVREKQVHERLWVYEYGPK